VSGIVADLLLDTSLLIDWSKGEPSVPPFIASVPAGTRFRLHPVTVAEFLAGLRNKRDQTEGDRFLAQFRPVWPSGKDFEQCLRLVKSHRLSGGIEWPDCLIAATCLRLGLSLVTLNDKHFRSIRGLSVIRPY
jgi:predicted nucleic acid-binding protein